MARSLRPFPAKAAAATSQKFYFKQKVMGVRELINEPQKNLIRAITPYIICKASLPQSARPGNRGGHQRQAAFRQPPPCSPPAPPRTRGRRRCRGRARRRRRAPCTRWAPGTAPGSAGRSPAAAPPPSRPCPPAPANNAAEEHEHSS